MRVCSSPSRRRCFPALLFCPSHTGNLQNRDRWGPTVSQRLATAWLQSGPTTPECAGTFGSLSRQHCFPVLLFGPSHRGIPDSRDNWGLRMTAVRLHCCTAPPRLGNGQAGTAGVPGQQRPSRAAVLFHPQAEPAGSKAEGGMQPLPLPDMCNPTGLLAKMLAGPPLMIGFAWLQLEINCGSPDARVHQTQSIGTHHTCDGQVQAR